MKLQIAWNVQTKTAEVQRDNSNPPDGSVVISHFEWNDDGVVTLYGAIVDSLKHHGINNFTEVKVIMERLFDSAI